MPSARRSPIIRGLCVIPLGAKVRWGRKYYKSDWVGTVTGHPMPRMVECDGKGAISEGLLEVVEMAATDGEKPYEHMTREEVESLALMQAAKIAKLMCEVAALQELVVQQCEVIACSSD